MTGPVADPAPATGGELRWSAPLRSAAIVVPCWDTGSEGELVVRSIAGVLARTHRVEVIVLFGAGGSPRRDGALQVVEVMGPPPQAAVGAVAARALASVAEAGGRAGTWLPEPAATALGGPRMVAWRLATARILGQRTDVVVVAGTTEVGALNLVASLGPGTTALALPLLEHGEVLDSVGVALLQTAKQVLATSPSDVVSIAEQAGVAAVDVGVYLGVDANALREPNGLLGSRRYVVVVDAATAVGYAALAGERRSQQHASTVAVAARLWTTLRPLQVVAVDGADLVEWRRGRSVRHRMIVSRSDLLRVLAFARAAVVVDPGPVLARSVLEAMLHATAVVVPADTLAAGHVHDSSGGLVVNGDAQLLRTVRALSADDEAAAVLGRAGRTWALPRYGEVDGYARRVARTWDQA